MPRHDVDLQHARLDRLRNQRNWAVKDQSLAFVAEQFKRDVARPFKQLEGLAAAWESLVPKELQARTRLEALQRGVLTVAVDCSATHYRLDALIRDGLTVKLAEDNGGKALRKIKVRVDSTLLENNGTKNAPPTITNPQRPLTEPEKFDPEMPR